MKILFVAPYVPSPVRVRPYQFIRALAQEGHQIEVLAQVWNERDRQEAAALSRMDNVTLRVLEMPRWRPLLNGLRALLLGRSLWGEYGKDSRFGKMLLELWEQGRHDAIHVEHVRALFLIPVLKKLKHRVPRPALVFDAVDCLTNLFQQYARNSSSPARRFLYLREMKKMRRFEPTGAAFFDYTVITSEPEKAALVKLMGERGGRVEVVANGVDLDYFHPSEAAPEPATLLFSGKMSFYNNEQAVHYFVESIFPLIKAQNPKVKLILAGAEPAPSLLELGKREEIEVTGFVEDMRPFLRRAAVIVCPMLTAVGVQNKVLEGMAMGKAVVATPSACRALGARSGEELVIAPSEKEFAEAVLRLLNEPEAAKRIGRQARSYVERHHRWSESARKLAAIYAEGGSNSFGREARLPK